MRATNGPARALGGVDSRIPSRTSQPISQSIMLASTSDALNRRKKGPRRHREDRGTGDRRSRGRLRELCEEVLASYRVAQGEDLVTAEDRQVAEQVLRGLTPSVAR
jgi:hypothetical protein